MNKVTLEKENYTFEDLIAIIAQLRSEHGCPWDKEQTHESLVKYLKEESEEVAEAVQNSDMENLCEELGDVLLQVMLHSQIAKENGEFTVDEVIDLLSKKMIRRHPHVFGNECAKTKEEVHEIWQEIKKQEKAQKSLTKML